MLSLSTHLLPSGNSYTQHVVATTLFIFYYCFYVMTGPAGPCSSSVLAMASFLPNITLNIVTDI